jgi:hypothetical protein
MKRTSGLRHHGVRSTDPFKNLSADQLAYIGAIAMLYNDVEAVVDGLCGGALRIPFNDQEVLSRINGIEGKYALIKIGARHWGFDDSEMAHLGEALGDGGCHGLKKWRDAVIHARMFDIESSVARVYERQGRVAEVLLALDALKGLYKRLELMRLELDALRGALYRRARITRGELASPHKERLEQEILTLWSQAQSHRSERQSLPPMPEFPEDRFDMPRFREALDQIAGKGKIEIKVPRASPKRR